MKNLWILGFAILSLSACKNRSSVENTDTLPKDIALKPDNNISQQTEREQLATLIKEIESLAQSVPCTDASEWKYTAIGAKPCGGPSSYIAYPIKLETEILQKVQVFTEKQSAFNTKYGLISDCMLVLPPSGIRCEDNKAILIQESSGVSAN